MLARGRGVLEAEVEAGLGRAVDEAGCMGRLGRLERGPRPFHVRAQGALGEQRHGIVGCGAKASRSCSRASLTRLSRKRNTAKDACGLASGGERRPFAATLRLKASTPVRSTQADAGVGQGGERRHVVRVEGHGLLQGVGGLGEPARLLEELAQ